MGKNEVKRTIRLTQQFCKDKNLEMIDITGYNNSEFINQLEMENPPPTTLFFMCLNDEKRKIFHLAGFDSFHTPYAVFYRGDVCFLQMISYRILEKLIDGGAQSECQLCYTNGDRVFYCAICCFRTCDTCRDQWRKECLRIHNGLDKIPVPCPQCRTPHCHWVVKK